MVIPEGDSMNRIEVCSLQTNIAGNYLLHDVKFKDKSVEFIDIPPKDVQGVWNKWYVYQNTSN